MPNSLICSDVWNNCLEYVRKKIPQQTFETWFAPMKAISLADDTLLLQVPNKFFYDYLRRF